MADPVRRRVLELLLDGDLAAGEVAAAFDVSRPAVSRHLRVLREVGLVRAEVVGRRRVYALDRAPLAELDDWLARFRAPAAPAAHAPAAPVPAADAPGAEAGPLAGPAARLDALGTEIRRGRRARREQDRPDERGRDEHAAG